MLLSQLSVLVSEHKVYTAQLEDEEKRIKHQNTMRYSKVHLTHYAMLLDRSKTDPCKQLIFFKNSPISSTDIPQLLAIWEKSTMFSVLFVKNITTSYVAMYCKQEVNPVSVKNSNTSKWQPQIDRNTMFCREGKAGMISQWTSLYVG